MSTPLNLYDLTIPTFIRTLTNLHTILSKPLPETFTPSNARIYKDMLPLPRQIQIACDTAKFYPVRVASHADQSFADDETTIEQLQSRIQKTIDFLKDVKREEFDGKEGGEIVVMKKFKFDGMSYTRDFALPNFFFHVVTAYDILRMEGVEVGKMDYLGAVQMV